MKNKKLLAILIAIATTVTACGGGTSESANSDSDKSKYTNAVSSNVTTSTDSNEAENEATSTDPTTEEVDLTGYLVDYPLLGDNTYTHQKYTAYIKLPDGFNYTIYTPEEHQNSRRFALSEYDENITEPTITVNNELEYPEELSLYVDQTTVEQYIVSLDELIESRDGLSPGWSYSKIDTINGVDIYALEYEFPFADGLPNWTTYMIPITVDGIEFTVQIDHVEMDEHKDTVNKIIEFYTSNKDAFIIAD